MTPATLAIVLWRILGLLFVGFGILGAFLPLLPSVVFFILAAWAFGKGAPEWRKRLHDHPRYGPPLRQWADGGRVSRRGKRLAVTAMAVSFLASLVVVGPSTPVAIAGVVMAAVGTWLWRRPEPPGRDEAPGVR
jgi:uncharacterized protein